MKEDVDKKRIKVNIITKEIYNKYRMNKKQIVMIIGNDYRYDKEDEGN